MSSTPSNSRRRFLVRAAYYSFFTPLVLLLLILIFAPSGGRDVMRIGGLVSLGICVTCVLAGLASILLDRFSFLALSGILISCGVGFVSYMTYIFSYFPSC